VLLPYATVSDCEVETGKPGADCADANASRAPTLKVVFPNMLVCWYYRSLLYLAAQRERNLTRYISGVVHVSYLFHAASEPALSDSHDVA